MAILGAANSVLAFTVSFFGKNSSGFQPEYHMNIFPVHARCSVHFIILNFIIIYEYFLRNANYDILDHTVFSDRFSGTSLYNLHYALTVRSLTRCN
jgi:hypothetical protein